MTDDPSIPRQARGRPDLVEGRASSSDDGRVDELRQQLRSLGYLDAGVDRFVLAPAVRSRRPAIIALLASLRSGTIAAALLGPAAAIGLAARLPGLVTGVRDAIVIAIYMAVLFGAAVTVLSFLAALTVSALTPLSAAGPVRRGRTLSTLAGAVVFITCLVYLTLWWRTANAGFGWDAPVWTAFALIVAVAISLLVGHVVTLTARAVMVARTAPDAQTPRVPGTSWRLAAAAGVLAFAGAASLLVVTAEPEEGTTPTPFTVRSTGARITVLAIDGFDPDLYEQLHPSPPAGPDAGRRVEPYRLHDVVGWARATLAPTDSRDPARLWTTIATGRRPDAHGVERLETRRVAGLRGRLTSGTVGRLLGGATDLLRLTRPSIASNVERRVKTFWEVAARAGLRAGVVNWWATWPADPSAGSVISDRAILRLEHGGALDAELAPAELYDELKAKWPTLHAEARQRAQSYFSIADPRNLSPLAADLKLRPLPADRRLPVLAPDIKSVLTRSGELDATIMELAATIAADLDVLVVYLPGLDIAQHTLLGHDAPAPSAVNERIAALRRYYDYLDSLVSQAVFKAEWEQNRWLFVITQPGRLHEGPGILGAAGPAFTKSRTSGTVLDVAPTILHVLGIPVAKDLDGRVLEELFAPELLKNHPVRFTESYGLRGTAPRRRNGAPLDEEMIERLRSLGYVR